MKKITKISFYIAASILVIMVSAGFSLFPTTVASGPDTLNSSTVLPLYQICLVLGLFSIISASLIWQQVHQAHLIPTN